MKPLPTCRAIVRVLIATCLLAGCATPVPSADPVNSAPGLAYDPYTASWILSGDKILQQSLWALDIHGRNSAVRLRGTFDDALKRRDIQLVVMTVGEAAHGFFVNSASDVTGTALKARRLESTFVRQTMFGPVVPPREVFAVELPRNYLDARRSAGLDIRLNSANNDSMIVKVPSSDLAGFLDQFDAAMANPKRSARPAASP